jgi:hypothetical protein
MDRPIVVTVSGAYGGVGKTACIERLLPLWESATTVKVRVEAGGEPNRLEETDPEEHAGKDTARYLRAGARRAFFLSGPSDDALRMARRLVAEADTEAIVFETDSLAAELEPDLAVFVTGEGRWKPGAEQRWRAADLVVDGPESFAGRQ